MRSGCRVSAVVTCAGAGTRFGSNKLMVRLQGVTVLERTVRAVSLPLVDEVVVTVSRENAALYADVLADAGLAVTLVLGGSERHLSALRGLEATSGDIVVVHDGVRPFVTPDAIEAVVDAALAHGAAMLGTPSTVQVKLVDADGFVGGSLDRERSWLGQTPQAFRRELLARAYAGAVPDRYARISDDADLVAEYTGVRARMLPGHPENIKLTTPQDLGTARLIASRLSPARQPAR